MKEKRKNDDITVHRPGFQEPITRYRLSKEKRKRSVPARRPRRNSPKKQYSPEQLEKRYETAKVAVGMAGLLLLVAICGTQRRINDWQDWKLLNEQGELQVVPLIKTDDDRCSRGTTCYYAVYEYHSSERRETISKEEYKALSGESTIEVIAAGDVSRIAGNEPEFSYIAIGIAVIWGTALAVFLWGGYVLFTITNMEKPNH